MTYVSTIGSMKHLTFSRCCNCDELIEFVSSNWEHSQVFMCNYETCASPTPTSP